MPIDLGMSLRCAKTRHYAKDLGMSLKGANTWRYAKRIYIGKRKMEKRYRNYSNEKNSTGQGTPTQPDTVVGYQ
jgi:hypothetical protein